MADQKTRRNTPQREVILEELCKVNSHPTAAGIHQLVRRRLPRISLGTVYRNLDLLVEMGAVQKLEVGGYEARFDGNVEQHDHIRCVRCGRVEDVAAAPLELAPDKYDDFHGYEVLGHRLEFVGVCPRCRSRPAADDPGGTGAEVHHT